MKLDNTNVTHVIAQAKEMLKNNKKIPAEFAALVAILLTVLEVLFDRLNTNSKNSSIPPSQDPNRKKTSQSGSAKKKPGGQPGRVGKNLKPVDDPDEVIEIPVDRKSLPPGHIYNKVGIAKRQVVEFHLSRHIKEYQLEVVSDENGKRFTAKAPAGTDRPIQYGSSFKAMSVYMSMYQLVPYGRVEEYFHDQAGVPISAGSLFNFNKEAFDLLEKFEQLAKEKLRNSSFLHSDETGINVNGKRLWLHGALNDRWTLFMPHKKRGKEAMDDMDILPWFKGVSIHDHWRAYFTYTQCTHALCNAHHLRELQAIVENNPDHAWAQLMKELLVNISEDVHKFGGALTANKADKYRKRYREIIKIGDRECPIPIPPPESLEKPKRRGRTKKTNERNLLERLRDFENEVLRFMDIVDVPFTNNPGENDIRMTKVQQKISGCFKSFEGAQIFCRVRSFLITAQKHGVSATDALNSLFNGKKPHFLVA